MKRIKQSKIERIRRSIKKRRSAPLSGEPLGVADYCGNDAEAGNSHLIHVGGIADFHESLLPAIKFLNLMNRTTL